MKSDTSSKIAELTHRNIELANRNSELERAQAGHRIDMDLLANNHRAEVMYYESVIVQLNIDMQSILEKQDIMELQKMKE